MSLTKHLLRLLGVAFLFSAFLTPSTSIRAQNEFGSISGTVGWGVETPTTEITVVVHGNTTNFHQEFAPLGQNPNYDTGLVLPLDTYTVTAFTRLQRSNGQMTDYLNVGSQTVAITVAGQAVTNVNFDASTVSGFVKGNLRINGILTAGYVYFCGPLQTDPCDWYTSFGDSGFRVPLLPGEYRVKVRNDGGVVAGIVPITIVVGQTVENSSLQFTQALGSISGAITWGSEVLLVPTTIIIQSNTTSFRMEINPLSQNSQFDTRFVLPIDTYTVTAYSRLYQSNGQVVDYLNVGSRTVSITAGGQAITNVLFDASVVGGLIRGNLKVNGTLEPGYVYFCGPQPADPCLHSSFGHPGFSIPLLSGDYRVKITTDAGVEVGTVPVTVIVGQVIDLAENSAIVPTGQNVEVSIGNATVTFSEVTDSGVISVTATTSPQGGLPPSEYRLLGTYYELSTTATYTGSITIQFIYNDSDVRGKESNLKLFHWDGSAWFDITTPPVDTVNNIITGSSATLSPFVIGEFIAPIVGDITATVNPKEIGNPIQASANFSDAGSAGVYSATWEWGDGLITDGTVNQQAKSVSDYHTYTSAGVYTVTLTVTKDNNASDESIYHYIVIYDPEGGFVTGGGTITSPVGAYILDSGLTGNAQFGFVSKYEHGANIPSGQTEFQFKLANLNFHSTDYDWLVVAGSHAKYKGSGSINGVEDYAFMLTSTDGQVNGGGGSDKFRMKIWRKETNQVIYDNQLGIPDDADATMGINSGNIVIHN